MWSIRVHPDLDKDISSHPADSQLETPILETQTASADKQPAQSPPIQLTPPAETPILLDTQTADNQTETSMCAPTTQTLSGMNSRDQNLTRDCPRIRMIVA